ncbi:hypothetical protein LJR269_006546 [Duganella sp. LjRoot269]
MGAAPAAAGQQLVHAGRGVGQRRCRGAPAAAVDLVQQLEEAPARRRAGGAGWPAAGGGHGHRRAARAGRDRGSGGQLPHRRCVVLAKSFSFCMIEIIGH